MLIQNFEAAYLVNNNELKGQNLIGSKAQEKLYQMNKNFKITEVEVNLDT